MRWKSSDLGNLQDSVVLDRARPLCTFVRFMFSVDYLGIPRIAIIPKHFEKLARTIRSISAHCSFCGIAESLLERVWNARQGREREVLLHKTLPKSPKIPHLYVLPSWRANLGELAGVDTGTSL